MALDGRQSEHARMSNDGLTRSGTECFIAVPIWQQLASKGKQINTTVITDCRFTETTHA